MKTQKTSKQQVKPVAKHQPIPCILKKDVMIDGWLYRAGEIIYWMESDSKAGCFYPMVIRNGRIQCKCDGTAYTDHCRHVRRLEQFLLRQALQESLGKFAEAFAQYAEVENVRAEQEFQAMGHLVAPTPDETAALAESKAEQKLAAFNAGMQEQYAGDPRKMYAAPLGRRNEGFSLEKR